MSKSVFILLIYKDLKNMRNSILSLFKKIDAPLVKYTKSYKESYRLSLPGLAFVRVLLRWGPLFGF